MDVGSWELIIQFGWLVDLRKLSTTFSRLANFSLFCTEFSLRILARSSSASFSMLTRRRSSLICSAYAENVNAFCQGERGAVTTSSICMADGAETSPATVPVLYLDPRFLEYLADQALRVLEIIREFDDSGRPTPAASKTISLCQSAICETDQIWLYLICP